jgi:RimJ/RimL family protein N-acetyltransferase
MQESSISFHKDQWSTIWDAHLSHLFRNKQDCRLRLAEEEDAFFLWTLANDITVRKAAFQSNIIFFEDHCRWFARKLRTKDCLILILEVAGTPAGQIRYDKDRDLAEIDYAVVPSFRGNNLGVLLLQTWPVACVLLDVQRVVGVVKKNNSISIRSFEKAGFTPLTTIIRHQVECMHFELACPGALNGIQE